MKRMFRRLMNREAGFTVIEFVIAVAISGILIGGMTTTFFQMNKVTTANTSHMQVMLTVKNVGDWIVRDGQQAQTVDAVMTPVTGGNRVLRLEWDYTLYGQERHTIDYVLLEDNRLRRDDYANGVETAASAIVGTGISVFSVAGSYEVTVGAEIGGAQPASSQLTYCFKTRT